MGSKNYSSIRSLRYAHSSETLGAQGNTNKYTHTHPNRDVQRYLEPPSQSTKPIKSVSIYTIRSAGNIFTQTCEQF